MKAFIRLLFVLCLFTVFAPAALAQFGGSPDQQPEAPDPCNGTMDPDTCMQGGDPMLGAQYASCMAIGSAGQGCVDATTSLTGGPKSCATVYRSAWCYCNPTTFTTSGNCTYMK